MTASIPLYKPAPAGVPVACKVKHFKIAFQPWSVSWPSFLGASTTVQLPVEFTLELEAGSDRSQCCIRQDKRGRVQAGAGAFEDFVGFTVDGEIGRPDWWDGSSWYGGDGGWDWFDEVAVFTDKPGFDSDPAGCPLFYGGVGRRGHFQFRTFFYDADTGYTLRSIQWGLLIEFTAPKAGRHLFYKW
jgi:hypothetical protein